MNYPYKPNKNDGFIDTVKDLVYLSRRYREVSDAIGQFIESGQNFSSCNADVESAKMTGCGLVTYQLADDLVNLVITFGALDWMFKNV